MCKSGTTLFATYENTTCKTVASLSLRLRYGIPVSLLWLATRFVMPIIWAYRLGACWFRQIWAVGVRAAPLSAFVSAHGYNAWFKHKNNTSPNHFQPILRWIPYIIFLNIPTSQRLLLEQICKYLQMYQRTLRKVLKPTSSASSAPRNFSRWAEKELEIVWNVFLPWPRGKQVIRTDMAGN